MNKTQGEILPEGCNNYENQTCICLQSSDQRNPACRNLFVCHDLRALFSNDSDSSDHVETAFPCVSVVGSKAERALASEENLNVYTCIARRRQAHSCFSWRDNSFLRFPRSESLFQVQGLRVVRHNFIFILLSNCLLCFLSRHTHASYLLGQRLDCEVLISFAKRVCFI